MEGIFSKEILTTFLSLASENALSKIIKKLFYNDKLKGLYLYDKIDRENIVNNLRKVKNIKICDLDNDLIILLNEFNIQQLLSLKNKNEYDYKTIFYPLCKRYLNTIIKYYASKSKYILFISNDYELLEFLGLTKKKKIIHLTNNEVVVEEMTINKKKVINLNEEPKEQQTKLKKILKIKVSKNFFKYQKTASKMLSF
jgi:hypothetical protein